MKIVIEINPPEERDNTTLVALVAGMMPYIPQAIENIRNYFRPHKCPACEIRHAAEQARAREEAMGE